MNDEKGVVTECTNSDETPEEDSNIRELMQMMKINKAKHNTNTI